MLPDRKPQVTFTCNIPSRTCGFQFWIGSVESFYCGLSNCTASLDIGYDSNYTEYQCGAMECACIPGKMLCGEDGSVGTSSLRLELRLSASRHLRVLDGGDQGPGKVQLSHWPGQ